MKILSFENVDAFTRLYLLFHIDVYAFLSYASRQFKGKKMRIAFIFHTPNISSHYTVDLSFYRKAFLNQLTVN